MQKALLEKLKRMPPEVVENYYDPDINDLYTEEIFPLLTAEQTDTLKDLTLRVYTYELTVPDFLTALHDLINDDAKFTDIAIKILGNDLLLIDDFLQAGVMGYIEDLGGDPNLFRYAVPASSVAKQILVKANLPEMEEHMVLRLAKAAASRVLNARTNQQFKEVLTGPAKTSGVGLTEDQAQLLIRLTEENIAGLAQKGVRVLSDDDYIEEMEAPAEPSAEEAEAMAAEEIAAANDVVDSGDGTGEDASVVSALTAEEVEAEVGVIMAEPIQSEVEQPRLEQTMETVQPEDIQEVRWAEATLEENVDIGKVQTEADLMTGLVEEAISVSGVKFENEDLHRRFLNIVNLYFRDLRDAMETKSKMTMPVVSGGMGMGDEETDRIMSVLEMKVGEYHQLMSGKATQSRQQYVAARAEQVMQQAEKQTQKEQAALDNMFSRLVVKTGAPAPVMPPAGGTAAPTPSLEPPKPRFIPVIAAGSKPVEIQPPSLPTPTVVAPIRSEAPAMVAATAPPPVKLPVVQPLPPAPVAPPPPSSIVPPVKLPAAPLPPSSMAPKTAMSAKVAEVFKRAAELPPPPAPVAPPPPPPPLQPRSVVADIKYVPKLTGPVDELRAMAVKDFRRLSRDPHEATLKIRDKIDLLEDQSFEVKSAGIKAWQDSETNRLYLGMLRSSLEGKPIIDVIVEKEGKGEPVLSKAEFDAIMELNRKLRFG